MARVVYYVGFSAVVAAIAILLGLPTGIVVGYLAVAAAGLLFVVRDLKGKPSIAGRPNEQRESAIEGRKQNAIGRLEQASRAATDARSQPWFGESVVDLNAASGRAFIDGHSQVGGSLFEVPVPYFVLPLDAIVKWGFATESEVADAFERARSGSVPIAWTNPRSLRDLGYMGWSDVEAVARLGLFVEH
jgi:hypothetical protein